MSHRRRPVDRFVALLLVGIFLGLAAWAAWEFHHQYATVSLEWLEGGANPVELIGTHIVVEGYVGPTFGMSFRTQGRDYTLFSQYWEDHPKVFAPALVVRPAPGSALPTERDRVVVYGTLQATPNGMLLVQEPASPTTAALGFAVLLAAMAGICSAVRLIAWASRRQESDLRCHCGYDLRASTDRCPECGTPIAGRSWTRLQVRPAKRPQANEAGGTSGR